MLSDAWANIVGAVAGAVVGAIGGGLFAYWIAKKQWGNFMQLSRIGSAP